MGPKQVPDNEEHEAEWEEWDNYRSPEKSSHFEYEHSTEENISKPGHGFEYQGNDLPEKE